jgi:hypothetical protein
MVDIKIEIPSLEKLIHVVASGIGVVAGPWVRKRDAKADIDVERIRLLGRKKIEVLRTNLALPGPAGTEVTEGEIVEEAPLPLLRARVQHRLEYQEGKRQVNIEDIVAEAGKDIVRVPDVSAGPVDEDWTARFFGYSQDVSSDEMKKLWGQILAGEVRRPGSFSMRCLDVVRNLAKYEAQLFEKLAPFVIDGLCVAKQNHFVGQRPYGQFLELLDARLMR